MARTHSTWTLDTTRLIRKPRNLLSLPTRRRTHPRASMSRTHMVFTFAMHMARRFFFAPKTLHGERLVAALTCTSSRGHLNQR